MTGVPDTLPPPPVLPDAVRAAMPDPETDLPRFLEAVAEHGDVVAFALGGQERVLVNDGEAVARFLQEAGDDTRQAPIAVATATVTGDGLLSSVPPRWQPRRKVVQRGLSPREVRKHLPLLARNTSRWTAELLRDGDVDLAARVGELTLDNLGDLVFAADFRPVRPLVARVLAGVLDTSTAANVGRVDEAAQDRLRDDVAALDAHLARLIGERSSSPSGGDDVLSVLVEAGRRDDGVFHERWVRDEAVTLLVAGHDTTALLTTMALWLLSRDPHVRSVLRADLRAARDAGTADEQLCERVPLVRWVLQEALRLYPPVPVLHRLTTDALDVAGHRVPAGRILVFCPWVQHRDPRRFSDPLTFDPWRFSEERRSAVGPSYLPFGEGRRMCAGNSLAVLEAATIVSLVTLDVDLDTEEAEPLLRYAVSLRLPEGLPARARQPMPS